ncbi:MAG: bifunctional metallophosphatase/5'-nucleotidase [Candidatus Tectomicrobia bacterium]|uniref:Bifunctional metallophosphatase/5'-nucleotidase n=1 Tax=Tectimicrobiota bacterium TaxID=2528274 RepID=A0A932CQY8_UNCTE|nr:bifunctional metallophosphatase/5'-nucleotidase [Candidatus Tectomicrobia bacterium]
MPYPILRFMIFGICLLAAVPMIEATEAPRSLTILYTSNVQGNLDPCGCAKEQLGDIPTRAAVLRSLRAREKNVLVVDSGDAFSDGSLFNTFDRARRDLIVEAMSHMGYNYLNVGDTELGFNRSILQEIQEKARFMLLSANILDRTRREPVFSPYAIHNVGGLKVALIGLVTDRPSKRIPPEHTRDLLFVDPIIAAREYVSALEEQSDLVVVVAHLGLEREKELAQAVPQIDVIIGGHSSELRKTPLKVGKTLILEGGEQGQYVGKLSLKLNPAREVVSYEHELVPVDARHFPADRHIQTLWQAYKEREKKGEIYDRRDRRKSLTFSLEGPTPFEGKD